MTDTKIPIFQFCQILMKLKTKNVFFIPKQNIEEFFKKAEQFAWYGWLQVIDGKNLYFLILTDLMKLKTNYVLAILKQNTN